MENTQKRSNAYAKLFSFFKSKAVRNLVSAALLLCSAVVMLLLDQKNYIRAKYFPKLGEQSVAKLFDNLGIQRFNISFYTWLIFAACFAIAVVLLVGSIFSHRATSSLASKYGKDGSGRTAFGVIYYIFLLLISAAVFFIFCSLAKVGDVNTGDTSGVFLNLIYSLLIALGVICLIFVAVIVVYTVFLMLLAVIGFAVYEIARFAKTLDTDSSVFGSKTVRIITVTSTKNETKTEDEADAVEGVTEESDDEADTVEEATEESEDEADIVEEVTEESEDEADTVEEIAEEADDEADGVEEVTEKSEDEADIVEEITEESDDEADTVEEAVENSETEAEEFKFSSNAPRLKTSFLCRLIQSEKETADCYSTIKNHLLSYKGVNSRISWHCDTFNKGRKQCVKLNIRGKTVAMYISLDPSKYSASKYHHSDVSDKAKYAKTPMMLRVRSKRSLKYALELITIWMQENDVKQKKEIKNIDYSLPYESSEALLERGLIKRV